MKKTTGQNYRLRLTNVIDYIYKNLDGDLSVNTLADIAHMSPYHFHRIYRGLAKETLNATIRRLRLHKAAAELILTKQPILSIAKNVSYSSQEAFSRAFMQHFGTSPGEYRESKKYECRNTPFIAMLPTGEKEYKDMFKVEVMDLEGIDLIGYKHQGDYMDIGQAFEKLFIYAGSNQLLDQNTRSIGLYYDDPQSTDKDQLRSMACLSSNADSELTGEDSPERTQIPAGKCVTLLFKGAYAELNKPYTWLFGEWLPESGYEAADFPPFEEYLNDPKDTPPNELLTRIHCLLKAS